MRRWNLIAPFCLLLFSKPGLAQSQESSLRLLAGPVLNIVEIRGQYLRSEQYTGLGVATDVEWRHHSWQLGVKSSATISAHQHRETMQIETHPVPTRRYLQHVNFTPYFGGFLPLWKPEARLSLEAGPVFALSSLKHKDDYRNSEKLTRTKTSFSSKGIDLAIGIESSYQREDMGELPYSFVFNFQKLMSQRQYLVDITEFKNALTVNRSQKSELQNLSVYALQFNLLLF